MPDQATELRKLVLRATRDQGRDTGPAPRNVVVTGGKGGMGVTTLAVNLAVALAGQGARVVLVDADLHRADVAMLCGVTERGDVADVLSQRRDIHEVLVLGPAGIQLVPGLWAPGARESGARESYSARQHDRLLKQFQSLGRHADLVLVDVGSGTHESVRKFWEHAHKIVMVTTPDTYAVMDTYATIKSLADTQRSLPISLLVNQAQDWQLAADVHRRIDQSSRRFLGLPIDWLGHVPLDPAIPEAARQSVPFVLHGERRPAVLALEQLAMRLIGEIQGGAARENQAG